MTEQNKLNYIYTKYFDILNTLDFSKNNLYYSDVYDFYTRYLKMQPEISDIKMQEPILIHQDLNDTFNYYINARNNFIFDIYSSDLSDNVKFKLLKGIAVYDEKERNKNLDEANYIYYILTKAIPNGKIFNIWKENLKLIYKKERLKQDNNLNFISLPECYKIPKIKV